MSAALEALNALIANHAQEEHTGWLQEHKHAAQQRILLAARERVRAAEAAQERAQRVADDAEWYRTNSMFPALTGPHIVSKP